MDANERFRQFMLQKGLRYTNQRQRILDLFLSTEKHLSAQDLYELVRKKNKGIGYATVARTLKLFEESGISRHIDFGDGVQRFEHKYGHEHHDHLICINCGAFVEIYEKKLEQIQDSLVKKHRFVQKYHRLEIFGICPRCISRGNGKKHRNAQKKSKSSPGTEKS